MSVIPPSRPNEHSVRILDIADTDKLCLKPPRKSRRSLEECNVGIHDMEYKNVKLSNKVPV